MIQVLRLLLPALIPSWNFFDVIGDSPRVEYALLRAPDEAAPDWLEFRPRPDRVPLPAMLGRLIWNARWNETLFVLGRADWLIDEPTEHSRNEIFRRIAADLDHADREGTWLTFRIALLSEHEDRLVREIAFVAEPRRLSTISVR
jgi:hypothetical protein